MTDRPTARVILFDPDDRVLHFQYQGGVVRDPALPADAVQPSMFWVTPGGGVHPGETFEAAALRELWEETGISDAVLGPVAIEREKRMLVRDQPVLFRERIFVARTAVTDVSLDNQEDGERVDHRGHRWWTLAELLTTDEVVYPEGFAERVRDLREGLRSTIPPGVPG